MLPTDLDASSMRVFVNPSGKFVLGGPHADTGLTGRKIIVDTYGGMARHGGGAFSVRILQGRPLGCLRRALGRETRGRLRRRGTLRSPSRLRHRRRAARVGARRHVRTERVDRTKIAKAVDALFDLRPAAIIRDLDLRRPLYQRTAAYGHFGRSDQGFTWEQTSRVNDLRRELSL